jgi:hypothetical protein
LIIEQFITVHLVAFLFVPDYSGVPLSVAIGFVVRLSAAQYRNIEGGY